MTLEVAPYDPSRSYSGQKQFDCEHEAINAFVRSSLKQQVKRQLSVAYAVLDPAKDDTFAGFYTIASHMIPLDRLSALHLGSLPKLVPCTRLIMLGVDKNYKGNQVGSRLMKHALQLTKSTAAQIGSFGLYLDADQGAYGFYEKLGFEPLSGNLSPSPSPMFLPISRIP